MNASADCLALEYEYPAVYGEVHHLTVLCYMLQHNAYSRDAWPQARQLLSDFLNEDYTPAEFRNTFQSQWGDGREGSIIRGPKMAKFGTFPWTLTIVDVSPENPDSYCHNVRHWAAAVIHDSAAVA